MMLKPGLGKGLGELMQGDQVAGKERSSQTAAPLSSASFGRGIKTLVGAGPTQAEPKRFLLPAWFYFAADLLLLAYTIAITFDAARPFDTGTILFCAVSVTLGAVLATQGLYQVSTAMDSNASAPRPRSKRSIPQS